jgi:hypothetical protein
MLIKIGKPLKTGTFRIKAALARSHGVFTTDGEDVLFLDVNINVNKDWTAVEKATAIRVEFERVIGLLHMEDRERIHVRQYMNGVNFTNSLLICNGKGAQLAHLTKIQDDTMEEDEFGKLGDIQGWYHGVIPHPSDASGVVLPAESAVAESVTDGVRVTVDLSGIPAGGMITFRAEGEDLFSIDTVPYMLDPLGCLLLELDLAYLLDSLPLIDATTRTSLLSPISDSEENPFDGICIELVEISYTSYSIQVVDPGLTLREEFFFEPGEVVVGNKFCEATVNSTGHAGRAWCTMDPSMTGSILGLSALDVPNQFGIFFAGPNQIQIPFGDGFRCVGGGVTRLTSPQMATENQASAEIEIELLPLELSSEVNIQYWFRDPLAGGSNFNLTDAVRVDLLGG